MWGKLKGFLLLALVIGGAGASEYEPMQKGRQLTQAFYQGEIAAVRDQFSEAMKQNKSRDQLVNFHRRVSRGLGRETRVLDERVFKNGGLTMYERKVVFENSSQAYAVRWAFDDRARVAGFVIRPAGPVKAAPTSHADYRTKADLRLPFFGRWFVFWGGRSVENNYHAKSADQRFAYDFLVMRDGSSHDGSGEANSDYYCWGEPVLAPAGGEVVVARDGLADNRPGQMDPKHPPGNYVVIDHGNEEFSFLAHLRRGSVAVSEGEAVEPGQQIGVCGNSGNSSEPHLHYHLQNTARFGAGQGLPAQFQVYRADGERVERGEPVKGQVVAPAG